MRKRITSSRANTNEVRLIPKKTNRTSLILSLFSLTKNKKLRKKRKKKGSIANIMRLDSIINKTFETMPNNMPKRTDLLRSIGILCTLKIHVCLTSV